MPIMPHSGTPCHVRLVAPQRKKPGTYHGFPHAMALMTASTVGESLEKTWELRDNYNVLVDWDYSMSGNLLVHTVLCSEPDNQLRIFLIERALACGRPAVVQVPIDPRINAVEVPAFEEFATWYGDRGYS